MPLTEGQTKTQHYRSFEKGMQQTASRPALDDKESWWLENMQPIGSGQLRILQPRGPDTVTVANGIATMFGVAIKIANVETDRIIVIGTDGAVYAFNPNDGTISTIAGAGTVTTKCRVTMWQDTPVLLGDPVKGYFSWDGVSWLHYPYAFTGTTTAGSPIITGITPNTTPLKPGMHMVGPGGATLPAGATILTVDSSSQVTMSGNATTSGSLSITVGAGAPTTIFDLAVFEGRAIFIIGSRVRMMAAPGSYTDFQFNDGALASSLTDSVFSGDIKRILSSLEVLWEVGPAAINALSNIQITAGLTTFSDTNIICNVGSLYPSSVTSFFRTFLLLAGYGVYAVVGATPQKLSDQLDGLFNQLTFTTDHPAGIVAINRVFVWAVLIRHTDPATNVTQPILLCLSRNAWFVATQGNLTWITTVVNPTTGNPELWGTDGSKIWQCFIGTNPGFYKWQTKEYDFGEFTRGKQALRFALELQNAPAAGIQVTASARNDQGQARNIPLKQVVPTLFFVGLGGDTLTFLGAGSIPILWTTGQTGSLSTWSDVNMEGRYIGYTVEGTSQPFTISGMAQEISPLGEWT